MMRSLFSRLYGASKSPTIMNILSARKASRSGKSDDQQQDAEINDGMADNIARNVALMDTILSYLDENDPASPLYQTPVQTRNLIVKKWAASLPAFEMSPDNAVLPQYTECGNSPRLSNRSSAGPLLSDSSSYEESGGPKTPTCSSPTELPYADVGLAGQPLLPAHATGRATSRATSKADPKIRRKFSFELDPEPPSRTAPDIPNRITRGDSVIRAIADNSNISPCPHPPPPKMQATITSLVDDFLPDYIPSPQIIPTKKSTKPALPELRIDTKGFHTPINQPNPLDFPELELSPPKLPVLHVGDMISPRYTQQLLPPNRRSPGENQNLRLVTISDRDLISNRHSIANPPPKHLNYDEFRKGTTRYSLQERIPSKRVLNDVHEHELHPVRDREFDRKPARPVSKFQGYQVHSVQEQDPSTVVINEPLGQILVPSVLQAGHAEHKLLGKNCVPSILQVGHVAAPVRRSQAEIEGIPVSPSSSTKQRRSREEIEAIPVSASSSTMPTRRSPAEIEAAHISTAPSTKPSIKSQAEIEAVPASPSSSTKEEPLGFGTNRGIWFKGGFFAKEQGLQLKMTRMVTTFSKMEWVIQDLSGTRQLKCFAPTNSLSRWKNFFDVDGTQLFNFQKRIGSTRVAESPCGAELFTVQNISLPAMPHWKVNLASGSYNSTTQWIAKGDEDLENVIVHWGGFEVGRIRCESRVKKHTYIVSILPEMNFAIMAALATVFDDLRTDEGY